MSKNDHKAKRPQHPSESAKIAELTADLQRLQAEFINFRRRSEEGRAEVLDLARQDVVLQLLPVFDNMDRALAYLPADLEGHDWAKGVAQVAKQSQEVLKSLGVKRIQSIGQPFDPHLHEAIAMAGGDGEVEVVVEELQPGYKLGDKVIRHAMVKVGRQSPAPPPGRNHLSGPSEQQELEGESNG